MNKTLITYHIACDDKNCKKEYKKTVEHMGAYNKDHFIAEVRREKWAWVNVNQHYCPLHNPAKWGDKPKTKVAKPKKSKGKAKAKAKDVLNEL